ncbi:MAG: hypothetical protein ACQEXJ_19930 [Myxococcota bacterium]
MRPSLAVSALVLSLTLAAPVSRAVPPDDPARDDAPAAKDQAGAEEPERKEDERGEPKRRRPPERPDRGREEDDDSDRERRRGIEETPKPSPEQALRRERLLSVPVHSSDGCAMSGLDRLRERLLGLRNQSQVMTLEVWGDTRAYGDGQEVLFYARVPFRAYLTIFWIGPEGSIFVPFDNLPIPAHRNVQIDADAVIVPPLGHERWVALATLEPIHLPCGSAERAVLTMIDRVVALPHAVGRWEVWSGTEEAPEGE